MTYEELGKRLLSSQSRISSDRFNQPDKKLSGADLGKLNEKVREITQGRLHIDDTPGLTVSQIGAIARQLVSAKQMGLLIVDYLGKINGQPQRGESRQAEVSRISSGLKNIARECGIPVLVLHQLNRQSELREDRRPRMADLRDSGQIEADADVIMLLHRPETVNPLDRPNEADLFIAKNRMGSTGAVRLAFLKDISRFENLATTAAPVRGEVDWTVED
jgi:replicative DNA helicase